MFFLKKLEKKKISVIDNSRYLELESFSTNTKCPMYTFAESVTVDILERIDSLNKVYFIQGNILDHSLESELEFKEDGLYRITHDILPTYEWAERNLKYLNSLDAFSNVYVIKQGDIYEYINGEYIKKNILDYALLDRCSSNVQTQTLITTSIADIEDYYDLAFKESFKEINEHDLHIIRNLIQMFIDAIMYCMCNNQYFEALYWIERFYTCKALQRFFNLAKPRKPKCNCGCCGRHRYSHFILPYYIR